MNFLERLADEAKKKKDQIFAKPAAPAPAPVKPATFIPLKNPQAAAATVPKPVVPAAPKVDTSLRGSVNRVGTQWGLGAVRSLTGAAQGVSGIADMVGKGPGTSRVSKKLDEFAKFTDDTARNESEAAYGKGQQGSKVLNMAYKGGQVSTDAGTSVLPGGAAKTAGAKLATLPVVKTVPKLVKPVATAATASIKALEAGSAPKRLAATALKTLKPSNVVGMGTNVSLDLGAEASKGNEITPADVARSVATNLAFNSGLPIAGHLASEGVDAIKPLVRPAVDATADVVKKGARAAGNYADDLAVSAFNVKPHRNIPDEAVQAASRVRLAQRGVNPELATEQDYQIYKDLELHLGSGNDPTAIDRIILDRQTWADNGRKQVEEQRRAIEKANASGQGGFVRIPGRSDDAGDIIDVSGEQPSIIPARPQSAAGARLDKLPTVKPIEQAVNAAPENIQDLMAQRQAKLVQQATSGKEAVAGNAEAATGELVQPDDVPANPRVVQNRLTRRGAEGEQNLSDEVMAGIQGDHNVRSTDRLDRNSVDEIRDLDDDTVVDQARNRLTVELGKIDDETVAFTNQAIERAQAAGRMQDAIDLHDALSEHLVKAGQTIQAASLLYRLSPQGMFYKARRDLIKSGTKLTPELEARLAEQTKAIQDAPDEAIKTAARAALGKTVADNMKKGRANKLISVWKAGLLSGQKTFQGGVMSNATFAALKKISDVPAVLADTTFALAGSALKDTKIGRKIGLTGDFTKSVTMRGTGSGALEGARKGLKTLRTGIDERNITDGGKYEARGELNFKNPVINTIFGKTSNMVFRTLSAADQPFYYAAAKNNLYDQAIAKVKSQKGSMNRKQYREAVENLVANPTKEMAQVAKDAADKAVLGYDTVGSRIIQGIHRSIDQADISDAGKAGWNAVVDVLAPFVRVPTAFISRTVDFTPLGIGKEIFSQISKKKFDQRALSEAIGQGVTGAGLIAMGVNLAQNDMLSGDFPKDDPKEQARWQTQQIKPNSVKLGGTWVSLNYLGPVGLLFNAGKQMEDGNDEGLLTQIGAAGAGLGQGLLGQSFLQGFSGFADAIKDPEKDLKKFANSQLASTVPAWLNDIANLTDPYQRQADTPVEAAQNRIPGFLPGPGRTDNQVKQDVYGNPLKQASGQGDTLNALKPSDDLADKSPAVAEVARLHAIDPDNKDLQVTPTAIQKSVSVEGTQVKLSDDQRYELQTKTGQATQDAWNKLITTEEYQKLDDADKAKALTGLRQAAQELAQREYIEDKSLATYDKKLSNAAKRLQSGGNVARFARVSNADDDVTYADRYDDAVAELEQDGDSWSAIQRSKKQRALEGLTIKKDYPNDIVDLYGLSKQQVYDIVNKDADGKALVQQLLDFGDRMQAAGLGDNPYRDSKGNVTIKPKQKSASGGSGSTRTAVSSFRTPYDSLISTSSKGASLARSAGLAKRRS